MFFYKVGYTDWEECPYTILSHTTKFTKEEFDKILLDAYAESNKIESDRHSEWLKDYYEKEYEYSTDKDIYKYKPTINLLFGNIVNFLIKIGFQNLDIECSFMPSANGYISDEDDESYDKDEELSMIKNRLTIVEPRDNKINDILDNEN